LGLVNISIGTGSVISGIMASLNWSGVQKYLKIEVDVTGGTNFTLMGTQQLVSVPYSLFADKAGSVLNQWQFNVNGIHYNGGKVGIGTALPEAKLSLVGDETGVTPDGVPDTRRFLFLNNKSTGQYSTVFSQFQAGASNTNTTLGHHASGYYVSDLADYGQLWSTGKGLVLRASPVSENEPNTSVIKFMTGYSSTTGSNERMRISETGYIGVGTRSPEAKLSLVGDETGVTGLGVPDTRRFLYLKNNSTGQYSTVYSQYQAGTSNYNTTLAQHASTYFQPEFADFGQLWSTGKGLVLRASPPNASEPNIGVIKFMTGYNNATGSIERMRITEKGYVTIGTGVDYPIAKLTIQENADGLSSTDNRNFLALKNTSNSIASSANLHLYAGTSNTFTQLSHNASSYTTQLGYADYGLLSSTGAGMVIRSTFGVLRFETGVNGLLQAERMRITNDGNIGIGTTLPKAKLEVKDGDVYVNDPTKGIILKSPNAACWRVTIDNTGNFVRTSITCPN
jgi:hypothetical protein